MASHIGTRKSAGGPQRAGTSYPRHPGPEFTLQLGPLQDPGSLWNTCDGHDANTQNASPVNAEIFN